MVDNFHHKQKMVDNFVRTNFDDVIRTAVFSTQTVRQNKEPSTKIIQKISNLCMLPAIM